MRTKVVCTWTRPSSATAWGDTKIEAQAQRLGRSSGLAQFVPRGGREASRTRTVIDEYVAMPIILWLLGVPVTLVLVLWFFGIVGF